MLKESSVSVKMLNMLCRLCVIFILAIVFVELWFVNLQSMLFPSSSVTVYLLVTSGVLLFAVSMISITGSLHRWFLLFACFLAGGGLILCNYQLAPSGDSAMLTSVWAHLFFLSRPIALGCGIAAFIGYLIQIYHSDPRLENLSHILSLIAGTSFLGGEIAGSYWAFIGWGKSWSWSGHFFFSALIYLLFILVFHLPKSWCRHARSLYIGRAIVLGVTSSLMLGYKLI